MSKVVPIREPLAEKGAVTLAATVVVEGREIPNLRMMEHGDTIELIIDRRMGFEFPREHWQTAACAIAHAMAFGAGYACATSEKRDRPFAPRVSVIDGDSGGEP